MVRKNTSRNKDGSFLFPVCLLFPRCNACMRPAGHKDQTICGGLGSKAAIRFHKMILNLLFWELTYCTSRTVFPLNRIQRLTRPEPWLKMHATPCFVQTIGWLTRGQKGRNKGNSCTMLQRFPSFSSHIHCFYIHLLTAPFSLKTIVSQGKNSRPVKVAELVAIGVRVIWLNQVGVSVVTSFD